MQNATTYMQPLTGEAFPTNIRSSGVGFVYGMGRLANVFGPLAIASIFTGFGSGATFIFITAAIMTNAVLVAVFCKRTRGRMLEDITKETAERAGLRTLETA
jgi:putative MFS transporter